MAALAAVELDEIRVRFVLLADEDSDAEHGIGRIEQLIGPPRRLLRKDEPDHVGTRLDCGVDVLLLRETADLDKRPREQLTQLRSRVWRSHQRRADKDGVGSGELGRRGLGPRVDRALRYDDPVPRSLRHEFELGGAVDAEGGEVSCVDADHGGAEARRALELVLVVGLHERVESELLRDAHELSCRRVVEVAEDEERRVGARLPPVPPVLLRPEETLCEQRQADGCARRPQIVERARERVVDEDRNRTRSTGLVRRDDVLHPRAGADVAGGRRAALELGDCAESGSREAFGEPHERENSTSSSSRAAAEPESIASRATTIPSCRLSACPAAAIPPAALRTTAERCPPSAPASTSRSAAAFAAGSPPRSSAGSHRSMPSSSGSSSYSRTVPAVTSQTRFGPQGESSSMPPAPCTTDARVVSSLARGSASVRASPGGSAPGKWARAPA